MSAWGDLSAIFYQIFIFHQMIAIQKLSKMFISSLFVLEIFKFLYFGIPLFFSLSATALVDPIKILKIYDVSHQMSK